MNHCPPENLWRWSPTAPPLQCRTTGSVAGQARSPSSVPRLDVLRPGADDAQKVNRVGGLLFARPKTELWGAAFHEHRGWNPRCGGTESHPPSTLTRSCRGRGVGGAARLRMSEVPMYRAREEQRWGRLGGRLLRFSLLIRRKACRRALTLSVSGETFEPFVHLSQCTPLRYLHDAACMMCPECELIGLHRISNSRARTRRRGLW